MTQNDFELTPLAGKVGMPLMVRINPGLLKRLRSQAKKKNVTITSIVEVALAKYLPELENPPAPVKAP